MPTLMRGYLFKGTRTWQTTDSLKLQCQLAQYLIVQHLFEKYTNIEGHIGYVHCLSGILRHYIQRDTSLKTSIQITIKCHASIETVSICGIFEKFTFVKWKTWRIFVTSEIANFHYEIGTVYMLEEYYILRQ